MGFSIPSQFPGSYAQGRFGAFYGTGGIPAAKRGAAAQQTSDPAALAQARLTGQPFSGDDSLIGNLKKSSDVRADLRDQLRALRQEKQQPQNPFALSSENIVDSLFGKTDDDQNDQDDLISSSVGYNFKEVTNRIQSAKTSVSAGRAVLAAKRKVVELKRKLASGNGDTDELQNALNHAKRIERVAKKKQRHLELEEMVTATHARDEKQDKLKEAADTIRDGAHDQLEDKLTGAQDALDEKQTDLFAQAAQEMRRKTREETAEASDEMIAALDAMVEELTEEEQEMLEEAAELLESMEILDPHMSEQKLKELKTRHRNQENKEIVKADADYLKESLRHAQERAGQMPGFGGSGASAPAVSSIGIDLSVSAAMPAAAPPLSGFDIQI